MDFPDFTGADSFECLKSWVLSYYENRASGEAYRDWGHAISERMETVESCLIQPLVAQIPSEVNRLLICPTGVLHILPLAACRVSPETDAALFGERFQLVFTPSLSLTWRCRNRERRPVAELPRMLVSNPTKDLPFTEVETQVLAEQPDGAVIGHDDATPERVLEEAGHCGVFHYSGHAAFDLGDPLDSCLVLAEKKTLSLRQVFVEKPLGNCTLAILNGCETSSALPDDGDDFVNLNVGFLFAGARTVLSTLWAVHDLPAALLMHRFHALWDLGNGVPVAAALQQAQRWLREEIADGTQLMEEVLPAFLDQVDDAKQRETCEVSARGHAARHPDSPPFANPLYWAAFVVSGDG